MLSGRFLQLFLSGVQWDLNPQIFLVIQILIGTAGLGGLTLNPRGKGWLLSMLEDSEDPVVKTVQPTIKLGRKWKDVEAVDEAKECLQIKEVIGQTQTDRKGLESSATKWSKAERQEKRDMVTTEIRLNEDSRRVQKAVQQTQQGQ